MHLIMILMALILACLVRLIPVDTEGNWQQRWQKTLFLFLFPPLILITTALAILLMGTKGEMLGFQASWFSYWLSFAFILYCAVSLGRLAYRADLSLQKIATYPEQNIRGKKVYLIKIELPYIAQIGFWQPKLVVSQGLLNILNETELEAVLAHEQAHLRYRDTFYFFCFGWLRASTFWLGNTEYLWEELLLLREMRADLEAAKTVDALTLAESLLKVVGSPLQPSICCEAGFSLPLRCERLTQRIDALINQATLPNSPNIAYWSWLLLLLIPWSTVPFHC